MLWFIINNIFRNFDKVKYKINVDESISNLGYIGFLKKSYK